MHLKTSLAALALGAACAAWGQPEVDPKTEPPAEGEKAQGQSDLGNMGIEDLMKIEVTTASKSAQEWSHVPAAIYVVTQEEISRSGATNVPELLRGVPGVDVAQMEAGMWSISIRGFNSRFANKLLVLIDGRSVYTPLFSGVYWDALGIVPEQIDRIEIIRGPGGALWGANAVNGIINIITKNAADTQGALIREQSGTDAPVDGYAQYGGQSGPASFYRVYAQYLRLDSLDLEDRTRAEDGWQALRAGFRIDVNEQKGNTFMFSGAGNSSHMGQTSELPDFLPPYSVRRDDRYPASNWWLTGRWDHRAGADSSQSVQASIDHSDRHGVEIEEQRTNVSVDFQSEHELSSTNRLVWGLGYRRSQDDTVGKFLVSLDPPKRADSLYSGFVHDEWKLSPTVQLTLGVKVEHNDYTGWEWQPSARLSWTPNERGFFWASVSRAVRTPSRADSDSIVNVSAVPTDAGLTGLVQLIGNPDFESESVIAYEAGYRHRVSDGLLVDIAAFFNQYDHLRTFEPEQPYVEMSPLPHLILPYRYSNKMKAETAGVEVAAFWKPNSRLNLNASYSLLSSDFELKDGSQDPYGNSGSDRFGSAPRHQFAVKGSYHLNSDLRLDGAFYFVDRLERQDVAPYARLDLQLAWKPRKDFDIAVGVQNLLNERHTEINYTLFERITQVPRQLYARVTWRF